MATIVLITESQNDNLYMRWGSLLPVDKTDLRDALYVDFPPGLDVIICCHRRLFCSWNDPEEAGVLAKGAAGQRSLWG